jgi:hypothetical protein
MQVHRVGAQPEVFARRLTVCAQRDRRDWPIVLRSNGESAAQHGFEVIGRDTLPARAGEQAVQGGMAGQRIGGFGQIGHELRDEELDRSHDEEWSVNPAT